MLRRLLQSLVIFALLAPVLARPAQARRSHTKILKCNIDGTYTCGGSCTTRLYCCQIGGMI